MEITYTIKEKKENPRESIIEMHGKPIEFNLYELEGNLKNLEKNEKELEGTRVLNDAKMKNLEANHPFLLKMTDMELFTVHMYQEARAMVKVATLKIEEMKKAQVADKAMIDELYEKMPEIKEEVSKFDTEEAERAKAETTTAEDEEVKS